MQGNWTTTAAIAVLALGCVASCEQRDGDKTAPAAKPSKDSAAKSAKPPEKATDRDPDGMDEGLADALLLLQDKFKCNNISGCPPQQAIIGFGWRATLPAQQQFMKARKRDNWRRRLVRIVAELRDPSSLPFLLARLDEREDSVVAHAIYGLALLDYKDAIDRVRKWADAGAGLQYGKSRLAARWALARWGDSGATQRFSDELQARCQQFLAAGAVQWGLQLCAALPALDCARHHRLAARHPGFVARREVVTQIAAAPRRLETGTLVMLANDPITSLRRKAIASLVQLHRRPDLQDGAAWRAWCEKQQCKDLLDPQSAPGDRQRQAPRPAATPR